VEVAKQPNINMPLTRKFVGTSANGDPKEAIQDALKQARQQFDKRLKWEVVKFAANQLTFPPLSVLIRVGAGKGDGGIGPKRPA
jgi:hypothetical protein